LKYDYIEIGISYGLNLCQKYPDKLGITIEPLKFYFDKIELSPNNTKINISLSDLVGKVAIFYVDPISFHQENFGTNIKITYGVKNPPSYIVEHLTNIDKLDQLKTTVVECIDWTTLISRYNISQVDVLKLNISTQNIDIIDNILASQSKVLPNEIYFNFESSLDAESILGKLKNDGYRVVNSMGEEVYVKKHMKIDKIIFASDDNPTYLSYWEINAKVCREVLEIEPVLFWITDEDSDFYHDGNGLVKKIKKLPDHIIEEWGQTFHSSSFQAQNVRLWGTKFFPEEVCLTSDIDLILFNKQYLDENVMSADPDDFVILGSDAYDTQRPEGGIYGTPRYPIPYLCGKGKTFCEIFDLYSDYKPFIQRLALFNNGFCTDELYVGKMISEYTGNIKIQKKRRGVSSFFFCNRRIEKFHFYSSESIDHRPKADFRLDLSGYLCLDNYIDTHLPGPYDVFKEKVDNLMKYIFELKKKY
jgi:hypothetical protein